MCFKPPAVDGRLPFSAQLTVILTLTVQYSGKLLEPRLAVKLINSADSGEDLEPTEFCPGKKPYFAAGKQLVLVFQYPVQRAGYPFVAGAVVPDRKDFADEY